MAPSRSLPFPLQFSDPDDFVESLLSFVTSSRIFQELCGGVHILEFLTQDPDLFTTLIPEDWRQFFDLVEIPEVLDLLMRKDLSLPDTYDVRLGAEDEVSTGCSRLIPPKSLLEYIRQIRLHSLDRGVKSARIENLSLSQNVLPKHVAVGMKPKKIHEVSNLAKYVDDLSTELCLDYSCQISHFVDFGSGQNYLGRALASPPYTKKIIAIESKPLNIDGARSMDVTAKLARKEVILRNKKEYRSQNNQDCSLPKSGSTSNQAQGPGTPPCNYDLTTTKVEKQQDEQANIEYIQSVIQDGNLDIDSWRLLPSSASSDGNLMVVSLHSCGNLLHHGLRSLILNPSVRAVALVGCCYNLLTECLPPPLTQQPSLRSENPRLEETSSTCDPHGFPMSERFLKYDHPHGPGIRFNITARMMAVQAPQNWTEKDRNSFFTRHFYRALFQKILVDKGVATGPRNSEDKASKCDHQSNIEGRPQIILGSLRKQCYTSFTAYARAAITKLENDPAHSEQVARCMGQLQDEEIEQYEKDHAHKKKELSIVWSLMAFSAGVVESAIVVDRWQWLREQKEVKDCWVESIFDYAISPRNLVVVGIR